MQGSYWNERDKKGCSVGCVLHTFIPQVADKLHGIEESYFGNHELFEPMFGIPRIVARLQDRIFEGLPTEDAKEFPLQFAQAIKAGVDYSNIWNKFAYWLLGGGNGVIRFAKTEQTRKSIETVALLYERAASGDNPKIDEWRAAAYVADATADAAYVAAYAAAFVADAAYDADAADAAADAAVVAYAAAAVAAVVDVDARHNHYKVMRDKFLSLLAEE
jgi:hypothetical protein